MTSSVWLLTWFVVVVVCASVAVLTIAVQAWLRQRRILHSLRCTQADLNRGTVSETPAAQPIDPAAIADTLRAMATLAAGCGFTDAANLVTAADLLETMADDRFSAVAFGGHPSGDRWRAYRKGVVSWHEAPDPFAALLAMREAMRAEGTETDETATNA